MQTLTVASSTSVFVSMQWDQFLTESHFTVFHVHSAEPSPSLAITCDHLYALPQSWIFHQHLYGLTIQLVLEKMVQLTSQSNTLLHFAQSLTLLCFVRLMQMKLLKLGKLSLNEISQLDSCSHVRIFVPSIAQRMPRQAA